MDNRTVFPRLFALGMFLVAGSAFADPTIENVVCRQNWPWSGDVVVEFDLSGASDAGVDLRLTAYENNERLGEIPSSALVRNSLLSRRNGRVQLSFDPKKAFPSAPANFNAFQVEVDVVGEGDPLVDRVEYVVLDLVTGEKKLLRRRDFYDHPEIYGTVVRDYTTVGDGFLQYIDDCFIWTGVNTDEYKTKKLALKRIPAGGVEWTMGPSQAELDAGVTKANGYWAHPYMGEGQKQVKISKDYFLAVFELTQEQCDRLCGRKLSYYTNLATRAMSPIEYEQDSAGSISPPAVPALLASRHDFGLKLPTEAQWEFAARCGCYDNLLPNGKERTAANFGELEGYSATRGHRNQDDTPNIGGPYLVGGGLPNAYGLWNMLGNVRERTRDNACIYPATHNHNATSNPAVDPTVPGNCLSSNYYTIKGGSFIDVSARPSSRFANTGGAGLYTNVAQTGWRLVLEDVE